MTNKHVINFRHPTVKLYYIKMLFLAVDPNLGYYVFYYILIVLHGHIIVLKSPIFILNAAENVFLIDKRVCEL